jgi:hypothetical protein
VHDTPRAHRGSAADRTDSRSDGNSTLTQRDAAQDLVQRIRQLAELEARQLLDRDPDALGWVHGRLRRWISSLQIACVALALSREQDNPQLLELVETELERWDPNVVEALMSFYTFIDGMLRDDLTTAMGLWVLWHTRHGELEEAGDENGIASEIGYRCVDVAAKWNLTPVYKM